MVRILSNAAILALALFAPANAATEEEIQIAMGCRRQCEQYRNDASSSPVCSKWNRTLPRPKVGRSCTDAFDEMFKSTCLNMCFGKEVTHDVNGACGEKRREMPKPVVGHACNEGYEGGYQSARAMFTDEAAEERAQKKAEEEALRKQEEEQAQREKLAEEQAYNAALAKQNAEQAQRDEAAAATAAAESSEPAAEEEAAPAAEEATPEAAEEEGGLRGGAAAEEAPAKEGEDLGKVVATLPVTVDESDINLVIYENQKAEDAVTAFCNKHMASAGSACMDQLLPHVERKLADAKMD